MKIKHVYKQHKKLVHIGVFVFLLLVNITKPFRHQDPSYNHFADTRESLGIPNTLNVVSNGWYLVIAVQGIAYLLSAQSNAHFFHKSEKIYYYFLFIGVLLTGFGSAYYHLNPMNSTLVWDRLPMTIVFMSFFTAVVSERINEELGKYIFVPLVALGIYSVIYWHTTTLYTQGGDLSLYIDVQYYPLLLMPFILYYYKSKYSISHGTVFVLIFYLIAKLLEMGDVFVFDITKGIVSGHTLKHIISAYGIFILYKSIKKRKVLANNQIT